ncbi:MAG: DUF4352 domain-containing protein [Candidatus Acidiferrales bacterium]
MKFCQHCGTEVSESQRFCVSCGGALASAPLTPVKQKGSRAVRVVVCVIAIFFAVIILRGIFYVDQSSDRSSVSVTGEGDAQAASVMAETPAQTAPADSSAGDQAAKSTPPTYNIGQPFSVGYWSYVCNRAFWTPWLGSDPYAMERANAEFIVIDITARNDDTSSSTLPPFQLMDKDGRTYDQSSAGTLSAGFFSVLEGLNPGVSKRGNVAFDVPPDRQYFLVVSGGIESDKRALVPLSAPPSSESQPSDNPQ